MLITPKKTVPATENLAKQTLKQNTTQLPRQGLSVVTAERVGRQARSNSSLRVGDAGPGSLEAPPLEGQSEHRGREAAPHGHTGAWKADGGTNTWGDQWSTTCSQEPPPTCRDCLALNVTGKAGPAPANRNGEPIVLTIFFPDFIMSQLHLRSPKTEKSGLAPNHGVVLTAVPHSLRPGAGPAGQPGRGHARWHGQVSAGPRGCSDGTSSNSSF